MTSSKRRAQIVSSLRTKGAASVKELAETLQVSESTIRRDLDVLDRNGELVRTYGGAALSPQAAAPEISFAASAERDSAEKEAVAERAAALVEDDMVVVLDIGTSTRLIARHLRGRPVTVITANLAVLDELRDDEAVRVCLLGGVVRRNYLSLVGSLTEAALRQVSSDLVFLSCTGVRPNGHVVDDMEIETQIKRSMIEAADQVVLVASEAKFPGTGSLRVCSLAQIDTLVTTAGADPKTLELCRQAGGKVVIA
ncbi:MULTISPECIES: DeoR/GlpR family DNA-binding transcription regulator [Actinomadura]|uniref:DeoR family transcriptional regulator n=1 Tax=Actinomadura litoris TaxID=2678616 RepID=A0A7K1L5E4_9ACTN|nr:MULTISPECIES: DeoR/GlpR family DNA-binding transcription regulator [Actinomadura]MBT2212536.1 DeoR/GlpR family DNA-binding transcription regulator [Actinomadura sp. NEAU-AAG7]MUN39513.1 DeoR family transcriptional regulator [Actinomadura litoris]